jgi:hypothetical protein
MPLRTALENLFYFNAAKSIAHPGLESARANDRSVKRQRMALIRAR